MHALLILIFLQIVSESFPVSSSGHVALALGYMARFFAPYYPLLAELCAQDSFVFLLHVPTIVVVIIFFRATWWPLLKNINSRWVLVLTLIGYAFIADAITALLYKWVKSFAAPLPLWVGFIMTAALLFSTRWAPKKYHRLTPARAALLGIAQAIALTPGISRLGTVYTVGRWLGLRPDKAFGVSWMLQFPLMIAATGWGIIHEIKVPSISWSLFLSPLSIAVIGIATILSYGALWLADYLSRRNLWWLFSIYMIVLALFYSLFIH